RHDAVPQRQLPGVAVPDVVPRLYADTDKLARVARVAREGHLRQRRVAGVVEAAPGCHPLEAFARARAIAVEVTVGGAWHELVAGGGGLAAGHVAADGAVRQRQAAVGAVVDAPAPHGARLGADDGVVVDGRGLNAHRAEQAGDPATRRSGAVVA